MMKWGRKKASPTLSHSSLITHVFPVSWLSKLKHKEDKSDSKSAKKGGQLGLPSPSSSSLARWTEGRFYVGDDDSYWRLSFSEEAKKPTVGLTSVWDHSDDNEFGVPIADSKIFKPKCAEIAGREVTWKFGDMVSKIRKPINLHKKLGVSLENDAFRRKKVTKEAELNSPQRNPAKHQEDRTLEALNFCEPIVLSKEDDKEMSLQWKNLKGMRPKEIKSKSDQQRRSVYMHRDYQSKRRKSTRRIKSHSPRRTTAKIECKIKALEDIKKAKRMKKKTNERAVEDTTIFDSFAVVKSSFNPQQDFRSSMIEMILENGIERPEELEELLVCYLMLNDDEYHDLIIKVFRQVCSELNELYLDAKLQQCDL